MSVNMPRPHGSAAWRRLPHRFFAKLPLLLALAVPLHAHPEEALSLTPAERAWLAENHTVRVRVNAWPPYAQIEPEIAGISVDYLKAIARHTGLRIEFVPAQQAGMGGLKEISGAHRHFDLLPYVTRNPELSRDLVFTGNYLAAPLAILMRDDSLPIIGLDDLRGRTVALEKDSAIGASLKAGHPAIHIAEVARATDGLAAVASGRADAFIGNLNVAAQLSKSLSLGKLRAIAPLSLGEQHLAMAARNDWPELASLLDKGLAAMTASETKAINDKWGSLKIEPRSDNALLWKLSGGAILVLLILFAWNRQLLKEIARRRRSEQEVRISEQALTEEKERLQATQAVLRQLNTTLEQQVAQRTADYQAATLRANQANQAKTEFLERISHDLRSPLTTIMGYAQMAMTGNDAAPQSTRIYHSAKHMLSMVNDLLEYAGKGPGTPPEAAPMYIHALLDALAHEGQMLAQERHNLFRLDLQGEVPPVLIGDARSLRRVLLNLLDNAAKYTEHGIIELALNCRAMPEAPRTFQLQFAIVDNGHGIPLADQEKVFTPFFRTRPAHGAEGTGLGLPIVRTLVEQMGGEPRLWSHEGVGTAISFELRLPEGSETAMSAPQLLDTQEQLPVVTGAGRCIWIVDDSENVRAVLQHELESAGFLVHTARDAQDFIEHLQDAELTAPSLVLTDFLMPGANGAAVLDAARKRWPGIPVVLLSAIRQSAQPGFSARLMKPVSRAELRLTIARLLDLNVARPDATQAASTSITDNPAPTQAPPLPREVLLRLRELVTLGAASDMLDYAEELARRFPALDQLALHVQRLAEAGDLEGLCMLADEG